MGLNPTSLSARLAFGYEIMSLLTLQLFPITPWDYAWPFYNELVGAGVQISGFRALTSVSDCSAVRIHVFLLSKEHLQSVPKSCVINATTYHVNEIFAINIMNDTEIWPSEPNQDPCHPGVGSKLRFGLAPRN